jgi:hypothetical protein
MNKTGIELIAAEREEQLHKHARTIEGDREENATGQLVQAVEYILSGVPSKYPKDWSEAFKQRIDTKTRIQQLTIAGALIAAEIDRITPVNESDPVVFKKCTLLIEVVNTSEGRIMTRTNTGFSPMELMGMLQHSILDIHEQINRKMKPDVVNRNIVGQSEGV